MGMWFLFAIPYLAHAAESDDEVLEVQVVTERGDPALVEPRLSMESVRTVPGALGDPLRALQGQAGVGRAPFGLAVMLVRGVGPDHQAAWLGEVRLPRALHFGGLGVIVDPSLLSSVSVSHAASRSRYGGVLGGAVILEPGKEFASRAGAEFSVDLLQASAVGRAPLPFDTELTVAMRRSWLDIALQPFLDNRGGATRLPWSQDGSVRLQQRTPSGHWWQAMVLGASDRLTTTDGEESADAYSAWLVMGIVHTEHTVDGWNLRTGWSVGPDVRSADSVLPLDLPVSGLPLPSEDSEAREQRIEARGRAVLTKEVGRVDLEAGAEGEVGTLRFRRSDGDEADFGQAGTRAAGSWAEVGVGLGPLTPVLGARVDATGSGTWSAVTADPRGRVELRTGRRTRLVGTAGTSHQAPDPREVATDGGSLDLSPERALHGALTAEQGLGGATLRITAFGARLDGLVVGRDDVYRFDDPLLPGPVDTDPWRNGGEGNVHGLEGAITLKDEHTELWLSGVLMRSERRVDGGSWHVWRWDQPWTASAVVSRALGAFRVGGRVRAGAGLPYTPVVNTAVHAETGGQLPVFGPMATDRLAPFFSVDVRGDWSTQWRRKGELGVFVDVQNATARANQEVVAWSADWRDVTPVLGLPVLPTAGVRGSL